MATFTQEQRDALPLKSFGEPSTRGFPITDQDDVESAAKLIGKAADPDACKKRIIRIAKRLKLTVPESWMPEKADAAQMGAADMSDAEIRSALTDALGDAYPGTNYNYYGSGLWIADVYQAQKQVVFEYADSTWRQSYIMDDAGNASLVGLPEKVGSRTIYEPETAASMEAGAAEFELGVAPAEFAEEDFVFYEGKIFEAGDYPDQNIRMTPSDIAAACQRFAAVPIKDTHREQQSIFAGKLGQLVSAWPKGSEMFGRLKMPKWITEALPGHSPKVSVEINRKTKRLDAIALLNFGQVPDAQVQAAFEEFCLFEGKRYSGTDSEKMQRIHDMTTGLGAACSAQMGAKRSAKDADVIQKMHDMSVQQGAACEPAEAQMGAVVPVLNVPTPAPSAPDKEKHMHPLIEKCRAFFAKKPDAIQRLGLTDADVKLFNSDDPADHATFMASLPDAVGELAEFGAVPVTEVKPVVPAKPEESEEVKTLRAEFESRLAATETETKSWRANFEASCVNSLTGEKTRFADQFCKPQKDVKLGCDVVRAKQSERKNIEALFEMAAKMDGGGTANFGEDASLKVGDAVEQLRKSYLNRQPLPYFGVEIPDVDVDPNADMGKDLDDDADKLLAGSSLGRAAKGKAAKAEFGAIDPAAVGVAVAAAMKSLQEAK